MAVEENGCKMEVFPRTSSMFTDSVTLSCVIWNYWAHQASIMASEDSAWINEVLPSSENM